MNPSTASDVVADPVGHISISGVHGRAELDQRRRHAARHMAMPAPDPLLYLLLGAALGAVAAAFLLKR